MPPKSTVSIDQREQFVTWLQQTLRDQACSSGPVPGPAPVRRLNRTQYTATIRDLLNLHVNVGAILPADGAGGEGFDNAAETLFISPIHAEKYLDAAKTALDFASKDPAPAPNSSLPRPGTA